MRNAMLDFLAKPASQENYTEEGLDRSAEQLSKMAQNFGMFDGFNKIAGLPIHEPTVDNVEDFVTKYVRNELKFFNKVPVIEANFLPQEFDSVVDSHVLEGSGLVKIVLGNKVVELPFLVSKGQFEPFEIIQMEGQRVPFTRDNFQKVIRGVDALQESDQNAAIANDELGLSGNYLGTDDFITPATNQGFMADVLSIRDTNSSRTSRAGGRYVTAATYDYGFDTGHIEKYAMPLEAAPETLEDFLRMSQFSKTAESADSVTLPIASDTNTAEDPARESVPAKAKDIAMKSADKLTEYVKRIGDLRPKIPTIGGQLMALGKDAQKNIENHMQSDEKEKSDMSDSLSKLWALRDQQDMPKASVSSQEY